jgi:hypothetical protein
VDNAVSQKLQAIPLAFLPYKQFINWLPVPRGPKIDKIPCDAAGNVIDPHEPENWLDAATAAASAYNVGFVFTRNDPFFFVDLDHAWDGSKWSDLASWACQCFPGAALELSYSGSGLHIFGSGAGALDPEHGCRRSGFPVEIYTEGRFAALTGIMATGSAGVDFSAVLPGFLERCGLPAKVEKLELDEGRDERFTGGAWSDDEIIERMLNMPANIGNMFAGKGHPRDLWHGNDEALSKTKLGAADRKDGLKHDRSAADAALMYWLSFWTGRDLPRMAEIFKRAPSYRPSKYDGKGEYRLGRILRLGARNPAVYDRPAIATPVIDPATPLPAPGVVTGSTMNIADQVQYFRGCVYVASRHAVMVPDGRMLKPPVFDAVFGGWKFEMQQDGARPTLKPFEAFTASRAHRFPKANGTCFRPREAPGAILDGDVNIWVPPVIQETPPPAGVAPDDHVAPFLAHVAKLLPDPRDRRIILTWMKSAAQNPGVKFQWAPVVQGIQGNGKSLLIRVMVQACGQKYSHLPKASQLAEKYNSWLEGNVFIGVEEIKIADRREMLDDLKDAITNDRIEVRGMGSEKRMADNYTNWLFCSNHQDAVPIDPNERRYAPFFTAQQTVHDIARDGMSGDYFPNIYDWLREGGYKAVAWWLRNTPVDPEFDPAGSCHRAPQTSSSQEAYKASLGVVEQEILEAVEAETPGFRKGWLSSAAVQKLLDASGKKNISPRKKAEIFKILGYEKIERSSVLIEEEGLIQSYLYRKAGMKGSLIDFLIDQEYHSTLRRLKQ